MYSRIFYSMEYDVVQLDWTCISIVSRVDIYMVEVVVECVFFLIQVFTSIFALNGHIRVHGGR